MLLNLISWGIVSGFCEKKELKWRTGSSILSLRSDKHHLSTIISYSGFSTIFFVASSWSITILMSDLSTLSLVFDALCLLSGSINLKQSYSFILSGWSFISNLGLNYESLILILGLFELGLTSILDDNLEVDLFLLLLVLLSLEWPLTRAPLPLNVLICLIFYDRIYKFNSFLPNIN